MGELGALLEKCAILCLGAADKLLEQKKCSVHCVKCYAFVMCLSLTYLLQRKEREKHKGHGKLGKIIYF